MSLSPALALYTLYRTRVYNTCLFFFLRLLFFGRRNFYRKHLFHIARAVYDDGALFFFFPVYLFYSFFRAFCLPLLLPWRSACVLKNHNRITIHRSLKSVRFFTTVSPKAEKNKYKTKNINFASVSSVA